MKKKTKIIILILFLFFFMMCTFLLWAYKFTNLLDKDQWTITQYGPRHNNSSFYTIYNPKQGLIVVDGGWTEDTQYVKDILEILGNEVDLWILTHPHEDHIGAFNTIYPDLQNTKITIHKIITVNMASPEKCLEVAPWDNVDAYNNFLKLNIPNLEYVSAGDSFQIFDLKIDILNAFDKNVEQFSRDYINDGSMMFKVTNKEKSMLFCADVGINMSSYLVSRWQDALKADYIQMGHHGYGGLEDYFYQTVDPQTAFFDAPEQMMFDQTGKYDNPENMKFMEELGCTIFYFKDGPNAILLK